MDLDLRPGDLVVIERGGVYTYAGISEQGGKPMARFREESSSYWVEPDKVADVARRLISTAEADRRLAVLRDTTAHVDRRPSQPRYTDRQRAIRRGDDEAQLAMLRQLYASSFALSDGEEMDVEHLERTLVAEIAIVLGRKPADLVAELHAHHAQARNGAAPRKRPPDPPPPPLPRDPFGYDHHEYRGSFAVKSGRMVVGDPIYTHAWRDEPPETDVRYNAIVPARDGRWHCYVELDRKHPDDPVLSLLLVHESIAEAPDAARAATAVVGKLWVDTGQMAALDEAIRDDPAFDDAIHLGADVNGITADRGCFHPSGGGDGTYPAHVHQTGDGTADLVVIDFAGESRDFLIDARKRLKLDRARSPRRPRR